MRIAWCTPLGRGSGVSKFSLAAAGALARVADVEIWREPSPDDFRVDFAPLRDLSADEACAAELRARDGVIFNMGNNAEYHETIFLLAARVRGVVVLHDKFLHHFFAGHCLDRHRSLPMYAAAVRHYYGPAAVKPAVRGFLRRRPIWEGPAIVDHPFFEPAVWNAAGVVVHSRDALMRVAPRLGPVPVALLHHPFYVIDHEYGDRPLRGRDELDLGKDDLVIVSHGFVNPNKRIDKVLEAIAADERLRERATYVVAGGWVVRKTADDLRRLAERLGLGGRFRLTGFVDDHTLHSYVAAADVCVNLRYPSFESSSGSLVEQLWFGKPVVVTRIGAYDELPEECVVKVGMEDEAGNLRRALRRLVDDRAHRTAVAEAGRRWALEHCSGERYAAGLMGFLGRVRDRGAGLELVDAVADEIAVFCHPGLREPLAGDLAREIAAFVPLESPGASAGSP